MWIVDLQIEDECACRLDQGLDLGRGLHCEAARAEQVEQQYQSRRGQLGIVAVGDLLEDEVHTGVRVFIERLAVPDGVVRTLTKEVEAHGPVGPCRCEVEVVAHRM